MPSQKSLPPRLLTICILLLVCACGTTPRHKMSNGKFPEWETYETRHFYPSTGTVTAVDISAGTVTVVLGKATRVLTVTPDTRIIHEGTDVTLAQLPLNQQVKISLSEDGQKLHSIWFGQHLYEYHPPGTQVRKQNTPL